MIHFDDHRYCVECNKRTPHIENRCAVCEFTSAGDHVQASLPTMRPVDGVDHVDAAPAPGKVVLFPNPKRQVEITHKPSARAASPSAVGEFFRKLREVIQ